MARPLEIGMTLLVEETNQTHEVNWSPRKRNDKGQQKEISGNKRIKVRTLEPGNELTFKK